MMEIDYPRVRAQAVCPLCQSVKESGLLVCWPCYRAHDLRHGNQAAENAIIQAETTLTGEQIKHLWLPHD